MLKFTPYHRACTFIREALAGGPRLGCEIIAAAEEAGFGHALVLLAAREVATAQECQRGLLWQLKQEQRSERSSAAASGTTTSLELAGI